MLCKHGLFRRAVSHPCVCLSVTFVGSVETNKRLFKLFHCRVATLFQFFHTKRHGNITSYDRDPPNGGVECRWGRQFSDNIWLHDVLWTVGSIDKCSTFSCDKPWQVVDTIAFVFDRWRRWSVYDKKPVNLTLKTTEHLIVRSDKSEVKVVIVKDCAIEANDWQTRSQGRINHSAIYAMA